VRVAVSTAVAPGLQLAAMVVFDNKGAGSFSNILQALNWAVGNKDKYNITTINMSIAAENWQPADQGELSLLLWFCGCMAVHITYA
jgi:hypothetical protein